MSLMAQQPGTGSRGAAVRPTPKNLTLLDAKTDIRFVMQNFNEALGVQCTYCHVEGDFAADTNPKKEMARTMIVMVNEINAKFPDGKVHVACYTCHRGKTTPDIIPPPAAPAQ